MLKKGRHKTVKKKIIIGAKLIQRGDPVANTQKAINVLRNIAKNAKRKKRIRKATSTMKEILEHSPRDGRKIIRRLVKLDKTHNLEISTVVKILSAPLTTSTIKGHLRDFARKKITFTKLMDYIDRAYERMVPHSIMEKVLHCRKGEFYARMLRTAFIYGSPKSLVTNASIKRMHILKMPAAEINEATNTRNEIHAIAHDMYAAMRAGDKRLEKDKRKEMRARQAVFSRKFARRL